MPYRIAVLAFLTTLMWSGGWCAARAELALSATPALTANQLPLDGEGATNQRIVQVANVSLSTDNATGLTLTITSGQLAKVGGTAISFQVVTVPANAPPPSIGDFTTPSGQNYTYSTAVAGTEARDVYLLYQGQPLQDPGTYGAALNLWVTNN
jgi:hypothetical protein